jgi:hypothetical protein
MTLIGELETTVLTTFCRRSNLFRLLSSDQCLQILKDAWKEIQKHLNSRDLRALCLPQMPMSTNPEKMPRASRYGFLDANVHEAFVTLVAELPGTTATASKQDISGEVLFHHQHQQGGVSYADFHTSLHHSIIYHRSHNHGDLQMIPAQIHQIFSHKRRDIKGSVIADVFFAVHEYLPAERNPFAVYTDFRAAVFHREPSTFVRVICASQVHCHAIQRPWDKTSVVMRPLDRV